MQKSPLLPVFATCALLSGCILSSDDKAKNTAEYFRVNVTGNAFGSMILSRDAGQLWFKDIDVTGDGGGPISGVEAILPIFGKSAPLRHLPPATGQTWTDTGISGDQRGSYRINMSYLVETTADTATTPAGVFEACVRVKETFSYPNGYFEGQSHPLTATRWFAPGVGPVKLLIDWSDDSRESGRLIACHGVPAADSTECFPLAVDATWTFRMDSGRSCTWFIVDTWK